MCFARDLDGDSRPDLVVAAPGASPGGRLTIYFGGPAFPHERTLEIAGERSNGLFSASIAADRDYDGDGRSELLVAAPGEAAVYLFRVDAWSATRLARFEGDAAGFGARVALADLDGDARAEVLIAAPGAQGTTGEVRVYSGDLAPQPQPVVTLHGEGEGHAFGAAIANAGDVFRSGADALLVGAFAFDRPSALSGRAYLYAPVDSIAHLGEPTLILRAEADRDRMGLALAGLGDVDRDGCCELAVAAPTHDGGGLDAGRVYVHGGAATPSGTPRLVFDGPSDNHQLAWSLALYRDLERRGDAGYALGAPMAGSRLLERGQITLLDPEGSWRRDIVGAHAGDRMGTALVAGVDFDGDGAAELIYSAPGYSIAAVEGGLVRIEWGATAIVTNETLGMAGLKSKF
jgi:hypothetical protein